MSLADHPEQTAPGELLADTPGMQLSRRQVVAAGFFGVLGSQLMLTSSPLAAHADTSEVVELPGQGFTLRAQGGTVTLLDAGGTPRQRFRGYRTGPLNLTTGTSALGRSADGRPAVVVRWDVPTAGAGVTGTFVPRGRRIEIVYDIVLPGATSASGGMMRREAVPGPVVETYAGVADWERDERGGIPYETAQRTVYEQDLGDQSLFLVAPGSTSTWRDAGAVHLPARTLSPGVFRATGYVALAEDSRPKLVEALVSGRTLSADVWTDQPFNIWPDADQPLRVHGAVYNDSRSERVSFSWVARDFDGEVLAKERTTLAAPRQGIVHHDFDVPLPGRGMAFVELTTRAGGHTSYTRTNLAVLPPHEFVEDASTSMFGLAADYLFGGEEERRLIKRMGVRRSRHTHFSAEERATYGFTQHRLRTPASPEEFDGDEAALTAYVRAELDTAEANGATHYECANEWNMRGGVLKGQGAEKYVTKWATAFRREIDARGSDIKLIPVGLAGMDHVYAEKMFQAGLAEQAHAFNLHPGRGNFVPDWAPTPDTWSSGSSGSYWNFLGGMNEARRMLDEHTDGSMEFWLTEVYSPTFPNSQWEDTYRHSAENTALTIALCATLGVTSMLWFQLYDNRKVNPLGANPDDREYHFGLLLRDHSPKPSLLAYATAAEELDEAEFVRWLDLGVEDARGLLFDTPRGPLSVLWSRADGYVLNTQAEKQEDGFWPSPEVWVDTWPTKQPVRLAASGSRVTEIDSLGRRTELPVRDGRARVVLDGAPRFYYGLDL